MGVMNRTEVRAVEAFIKEQHDACDQASEQGRTFEADVHYGMELGAMEALKRARRAKPKADEQPRTKAGSAVGPTQGRRP